MTSGDEVDVTMTSGDEVDVTMTSGDEVDVTMTSGDEVVVTMTERPGARPAARSGRLLPTCSTGHRR
jgi:hypothetical protein